MRGLILCAFFPLVLACPIPHLDAQEKIDFIRDVQPILANHCWSCHGPDENSRQGELRLDQRDAAIAKKAIVPGDSKQSQIVSRIHETDPETLMPPASANKPLTEAQKATLAKWIDSGAEFAQHWAFIPPTDPKLPEGKASWSNKPIDLFVADKWKSLGLQESPQADRGTLLRRVYLDLTGLPPSAEDTEAFLADNSKDAFEKVVDRLLASQAYAERMAMTWLDLARYADTNGYNNDEDRTMWPWRDWVIQAFHQNMPYDQFLVEQLAGDLFESPTRDQLIATGFLRNQGHNTEGGIIVEEYRVEYVADRVHTTSTVCLGLSMQCARCHDHKYDPISQNEYYQFYAYFNNLDEKQASYSKFVAAEPFIRVPSSDQESQINQLQSEIGKLTEGIAQRKTDAGKNFKQWLAEHSIEEFQKRFGNQELHHFALESDDESSLFDQVTKQRIGIAKGNPKSDEGKFGRSIRLDGQSHYDLGNIANFDGTKPFSISVWVNAQEGGAVLSKMDEDSAFQGFDLLLENGKISSHLIHQWPSDAIKVISKPAISTDAWHHIVLVYDGSRSASGTKIYVDGKNQELEIANDNLKSSIATSKPFHLGLRERSLAFRGRIDRCSIFNGQLQPEQVAELFAGKDVSKIDEWLKKESLTSEERQVMESFYLANLDEDLANQQKTLAKAQKDRQNLEEQLPAVMVMKEMVPPRETFLLKRGQYDQPANKVNVGVPGVLLKQPENARQDRLGLAKWLVDPKNPLTARVAVNRWWQSYFGTGIVKTTEDFGITGEVPSHPELLDYLAVKLIASGWNVKAIQKEIVMSATYQQDSRIGSAGIEHDPENRLLARGPRYRLGAETIRDNALAISGLLVSKVGGPSVKPYQPDGLWEDVTVDRRGKYVADTGEGLYRRSMYTFWKRTCPPPSMMNFDAPNREVCLARRARTNTPLQSLILLNDPTYIEAARSLAETMIRASDSSDARINAGYKRAVARSAKPEELAILSEVLQQASDRFKQHPEMASALNKTGSKPAAAQIDPVELASWTVVASTLLNLDETISKR